MNLSDFLTKSPVTNSKLIKFTFHSVLVILINAWHPAEAATLWVSPEPWSKGGVTHFEFTLPADMAGFSSARIVLVSSDYASIDYEAYLEWGGPMVDGKSTMFENRIRELDISSLMLNLAAEEYVNVKFVTRGATPKVLALRFEYRLTETEMVNKTVAVSSKAVATPELTVDGGIDATSFTGDGSTLTALDPANLSAGTAVIDISGTAATADDVIGAGSVSESELDFDPATQAELASHAGSADAHREHATLEESAEIDTDIASHAGLPNVHHTPTVDTDTVLTEAQVEYHVTDDTLDMSNNPITNIGASGTDFTSSGGLRLADDIRIDADLGIGADPLPGTERNIYMYDSGIYSDPRLYISGHNSGYVTLERRRTDSSIYTLRAGCGSVNCLNDFSITRNTGDVCMAIRDGCDVDIPTLEVDNFEINVTDSPGTCDGTTEGRLYYDASRDEPCFCNGTNWRQFDGGGTC